MADPAGSWTADGARAGGEPRWWTVVVPCLLALPASAWGLLLGAIAGISSTAGGPSPGPMPAIGVAEFLIGVATIAALIAALAWRARRRLLRRVLWTCCLLACTGLGVTYGCAAEHP